MSAKIEKVSLYGWENCYKLTNGSLEIVGTADIGPRIIYFGEQGGKNLLKIFEEQAGKTNDPTWQVYGGHRVWAAPEDPYFSYIPDNTKVEAALEHTEGSVRFTRAADESGLERCLELRPDGGNGFVIRNQITNRAAKPIRGASWGITAFIPGGIGILPLTGDISGQTRLQANRRLNLWEYTDLTDRAFAWRSDGLFIFQGRAKKPQKVGTWLKEPVVAYLVEGKLITKRASLPLTCGEEFPDQGSNVEVYFDPNLLELETLSAFRTLSPGESVWHEETLGLKKIDDRLSPDAVIDNFLSEAKIK